MFEEIGQMHYVKALYTAKAYTSDRDKQVMGLNYSKISENYHKKSMIAVL